MRFESLVILLALTLFTAVPAAQDVPNFTGTWLLHPSKSQMTGASTRPGAIIQPPKKIKDVVPEMPPAVKAGHMSGLVIIQAEIDADGHVVNARSSSNPMLAPAAIAAVRQWEFTPMRVDGVPTPVIIDITVNFGRYDRALLGGNQPQRTEVAIKQDARSLQIISATPFGRQKLVYRLDGGTSEHKAQAGGRLRYRSRWEGDRLVTRISSLAGGNGDTVESRYLEGATMVVETITPSPFGGDPLVRKLLYDRIAKR